MWCYGFVKGVEWSFWGLGEYVRRSQGGVGGRVLGPSFFMFLPFFARFVFVFAITVAGAYRGVCRARLVSFTYPTSVHELTRNAEGTCAREGSRRRTINGQLFRRRITQPHDTRRHRTRAPGRSISAYHLLQESRNAT